LNMDQETIVRMGKIVEKKTPHIANLQDDYQVVDRFARQKKEEETLEKWTERILQNTFIKIDDRLQNCEFRYGWLKNK
jgi:peptidyl-prolyl cis-trans isomerase SurA